MRFLPLVLISLEIIAMSCMPAEPKQILIPPTPATAPTARSSSAKEPSPTPTFIGTWPVTVTGKVYDASFGLGRPIRGATVTCSYWSHVLPSYTGRVVTDAGGRYSITFLVHDTDGITITFEASGFETLIVERSGMSLLGGKHEIDMGLSPLQKPTGVP
jgi:hypothetical protein